jgi:hypothetical protein
MVLVLLFSACTEKNNKLKAPQTVTFSVSPAEEWTALFKRSQGWFGGDGIFAIPFSGVDTNQSHTDSILFLFSDTMVGDITDGKLKPGYVMINNSCMVLKGRQPKVEDARFLVNRNSDKNPAPLFIPKTQQTQKGDYYWLGDGFVNVDADSSLYIFAYRIRDTHDSSAFPFREVGNALISIPKGATYPFANYRQAEIPFTSTGDSVPTSFGVGVCENTASSENENADGYIYVYGIRGKNKEMVAARIKPSDVEDFSAWEFYKGGDSWSNVSADAVAVADSVSNELSVTPIGNGKYALIYQYAGLMPIIYMQIGPSPIGPFGPRQKVWDTSREITEKDLFTYNAKAHPAISAPGELLVSYNVNSFNFFKQIETIPDLYRPRFVKIVFHTK